MRIPIQQAGDLVIQLICTDFLDFGGENAARDV
jgi:hypothetical protein